MTPTQRELVAEAVVKATGSADIEDVWICEFGGILSEQNPNGDCRGCSGRQDVRGCGPGLLIRLGREGAA